MDEGQDGPEGPGLTPRRRKIIKIIKIIKVIEDSRCWCQERKPLPPAVEQDPGWDVDADAIRRTGAALGGAQESITAVVEGADL